jgi:hypothetical protein
MPGFIADGFDRDGYIAAAVPEANGEPIHEAVEFKYRPATRQETLKLDGEVNIAVKNADIDPNCFYRMEQLTNKFLAAKLISWDLKDHNGSLVAITPENLERVHPILQGKLYKVVRGDRLSDKKPTGEEPKSDADQLKN